MPKTTQSDASRIQSSQAQGGKDMSSSGFAARAQSAADRSAGGGNSGQSQGGKTTGTASGQQGQSHGASGQGQK
ncbi:hypothetical protein PRK78_007461 [Emydomyces testavorans]|uniref:SMP domain-containing protein n=1 Tax=Emydomyces testavorans TaxID=2070801 RepID=A0AAF0IMP7_9EURO|nr:hypothetical protein PRK78_007461 [Emydomyces testavorans]